ncbi:GAF domain-containing sensor histidine kinase [Nitratireductor sp. CH_MIT9313-5]|uniref:GAF domain-containing sensor histidine kinase n=1 Tax=Nitratireductor sp. CH_MIT9313-5 TaxID=3107764 RepID=UPI00300BD96E
MAQEPALAREEEPNPLLSLLRISSHLAGQVEIKSALRAVKAEIENLLPIDHLDVCLIDDEVRWNTSYEVGLHTRWSLRRTSVHISPVRSILYGETDYMLTGNAMEDPRYMFPGAISEPILRHQLRSRINVAMKVLGRTIGALNCSSNKPDHYSEADVERMRHVADVLAPYFYSLRANEQAKQAAITRAEAQAREEGLRQGALELTRALEQERQRIGMDLHDQTLADLTRIMRDLERAETVQERAAISNRLQDCIQDLRQIIDTAVPTLLQMFGFVHALRIHLERAVGDEGEVEIAVHDETHGLIDRLDATTRIALFRIAQEAINNAARHSGGDRIEVLVAPHGKGLKLSIRDNGVPRFEDTKAAGGLSHMRTRARLIDAAFHIHTDKGTVVEVVLGNPASPHPRPARQDA